MKKGKKGRLPRSVGYGDVRSNLYGRSFGMPYGIEPRWRRAKDELELPVEEMDMTDNNMMNDNGLYQECPPPSRRNIPPPKPIQQAPIPSRPPASRPPASRPPTIIPTQPRPTPPTVPDSGGWWKPPLILGGLALATGYAATYLQEDEEIKRELRREEHDRRISRQVSEEEGEHAVEGLDDLINDFFADLDLGGEIVEFSAAEYEGKERKEEKEEKEARAIETLRKIAHDEAEAGLKAIEKARKILERRGEREEKSVPPPMEGMMPPIGRRPKVKGRKPRGKKKREREPREREAVGAVFKDEGTRKWMAEAQERLRKKQEKKKKPTALQEAKERIKRAKEKLKELGIEAPEQEERKTSRPLREAQEALRRARERISSEEEWGSGFRKRPKKHRK